MSCRMAMTSRDFNVERRIRTLLRHGKNETEMAVLICIVRESRKSGNLITGNPKLGLSCRANLKM